MKTTILTANGKPLYEGHAMQGKPQGQGKEFDWESENVRYEGEWELGARHGLGRQYKDGFLFFEGLFASGHALAGRVYMTPSNDSCLDRLPDADWCFGSLIYDGELAVGLACGEGKSFHANGAVAYLGYWRFGKRHGFGVSFDREGRELYAGIWQNDAAGAHDFACISNTVPADIFYVGAQIDGIPHGKCQEYRNFYKKDAEIPVQDLCELRVSLEPSLNIPPDAELVYDGDWFIGKRHGPGTAYRNGRLSYDGEWFLDKPDTGKVFSDGVFVCRLLNGLVDYDQFAI